MLWWRDTRRLAACFALLAVLGTIVALGAEDKSKGMLLRMPYLQLATPSSITIVWRTRSASTPVVRFGPAPDKLDQRAEGAAVTIRVSPDQKGSDSLPRLHTAPKGAFQYEVRLTGLSPSSTYYYGVFDSDHRLAGGDESFRFTTYPEPGQAKPLRFWVVGDSGTGGTDQKKVHQAMVRFCEDHKRDIDMYLHVGDMAYSDGTDEQFQNRFFKVYEPTLRRVVCWPAMGNHEGNTSKGISGVGPYYDAYVTPTKAEAGGVPSGSEAYYSFDYGRVHFICLDSHDLDRKPTGAMAQWLKADLEKAKADWLIAFWHHPPYSKGTHDSDTESQLVEMREHFMPILESSGVDLVLTGHSHIYERSMLIDGAYATPTVVDNVVLDDGDGDPKGDGEYKKSAGLNPHEGDVQVVTGNGGASMGRKATMPVMKRVFVEYGSTLINVDGDTLTGIMLNSEYKLRDVFSIVKRDKVSLARVATPRVLAQYKPPERKPGRDVATKTTLPKNAVQLIKKHDDWHYFAEVGQPPADWFKADFHPDGWKEGAAGFGYANDDDTTVLDDMKGKYDAVYIVKEFDVDEPVYAKVAELGLVINYDDAFIAYLNGEEVLRQGVSTSRRGNRTIVEAHDAKGYEYFPIKNIAKHLRAGDNAMAIKGLNRARDSSDFTLDPYLIMVEKTEKGEQDEKGKKEEKK